MGECRKGFRVDSNLNAVCKDSKNFRGEIGHVLGYGGGLGGRTTGQEIRVQIRQVTTRVKSGSYPEIFRSQLNIRHSGDYLSCSASEHYET